MRSKSIFVVVMVVIFIVMLDSQTAKAELPICTASGNQTFPSVDGDIVVWSDYRSGNWDIYGYDINTSTEFPICTTSSSQDYPAISGDIVVWQDYRNGNPDVYGYVLPLVDWGRRPNISDVCITGIEIAEDTTFFGTNA